MPEVWNRGQYWKLVWLDLEPHLAKLRTSVIHNDANDYNLIVTQKSAGATPEITTASRSLITIASCFG